VVVVSGVAGVRTAGLSEGALESMQRYLTHGCALLARHSAMIEENMEMGLRRGLARRDRMATIFGRPRWGVEPSGERREGMGKGRGECRHSQFGGQGCRLRSGRNQQARSAAASPLAASGPQMAVSGQVRRVFQVLAWSHQQFDEDAQPASPVFRSASIYTLCPPTLSFVSLHDIR